MNRKGYSQMVGAVFGMILLIIILNFLINNVTIENGHIYIPYITKPQYLQINMDTNLSYYETLQVNIIIKNPKQTDIKPSLQIEFDKNNWRTSNRYLISNEYIPFNIITHSDIEKYSIDFYPNYNIKSDQIFKFKLYDNETLIDTQEVIVHVSN